LCTFLDFLNLLFLNFGQFNFLLLAYFRVYISFDLVRFPCTVGVDLRYCRWSRLSLSWHVRFCFRNVFYRLGKFNGFDLRRSFFRFWFFDLRNFGLCDFDFLRFGIYAYHWSIFSFCFLIIFFLLCHFGGLLLFVFLAICRTFPSTLNGALLCLVLCRFLYLLRLFGRVFNSWCLRVFNRWCLRLFERFFFYWIIDDSNRGVGLHWFDLFSLYFLFVCLLFFLGFLCRFRLGKTDFFSFLTGLWNVQCNRCRGNYLISNFLLCWCHERCILRTAPLTLARLCRFFLFLHSFWFCRGLIQKNFCGFGVVDYSLLVIYGWSWCFFDWSFIGSRCYWGFLFFLRRFRLLLRLLFLFLHCRLLGDLSGGVFSVLAGN